jgi:hypothetical protein
MDLRRDTRHQLERIHALYREQAGEYRDITVIAAELLADAQREILRLKDELGRLTPPTRSQIVDRLMPYLNAAANNFATELVGGRDGKA